VWGGENSSQTSSPPQAVRRKIVADPSKGVNAQKKSMKSTAAGTPVKSQLSEKDPATELLAGKGSVDEYRYQGIVDPFFPLIRDEKKPPPPEVKKKKKRDPQSPLEKIDLTQLTLTAIFKGKTQRRGLVEEPTGKGYVVTNGTFIGLDGGKITKVLEDRILITEVSEDMMGKSVTIKRELKLRQSSGE
jgi:type IV pilus assembly protein PilP